MSIKRIKSVYCLIIMSILFHFSAQLGHSATNSATATTKKIVTTFTILDDLAKQVAGDKANVVCLIKYGAEIHNYEPTPQDLVKIQNADLILWNGLNLEKWFEKFFASQKMTPHVVVTTSITHYPIHSGSYANAPNPHAWMSPLNAKIYIQNILNALIKIDPSNQKTYEVNAQNYLKKLDEMHVYMLNSFSQIPKAFKWLATSEGAFTYLTKEYGFQELFLWPINADQQGSPKQIQQAIELMRKHKIPVIFSESTVSDRPAKQVAKEAGATYGGKLYVDSLTDAGGPVPNYLALLKVNTDTITHKMLTALKAK